jgi:DNA-directed RNA polymerase sigma subunit (sigma70/sigma32)
MLDAIALPETASVRVEAIASRLGVEPHEVIEMDCRLRGDASLNSPINDGRQTVEWEAASPSRTVSPILMYLRLRTCVHRAGRVA